MAGHRRKAGKPMVRHARPERRRANLDTALAAAQTPQDRVALAADHLRSALALNPDEQVADQVVERLRAAADRLHDQREERTDDGDSG